MLPCEHEESSLTLSLYIYGMISQVEMNVIPARRKNDMLQIYFLRKNSLFSCTANIFYIFTYNAVGGILQMCR